MSDQAKLFEPEKPMFGTDPTKLARRDDPETSKVSAKSVNTAKLEKEVFEAIKACGTSGCTSDQLRARYFPGYPYSSVTARYKALTDKGLIEIIGTRAGESGRPQRVMRALCSVGKP